MNRKVLNYALANIEIVALENSIKVYISEGNLYLETMRGRNFKLAEDEVLYQAEEYLKSEIESLHHSV